MRHTWVRCACQASAVSSCARGSPQRWLGMTNRSRRLNAACIACNAQKVYARRSTVLSGRTTRRHQAGVTMRNGASCIGGRWHALEALQELPGCQHGAATLCRVWGQCLQQQRQELADHAVAAEQRFGCLVVLRWSSQCADGRYRLLDPLARPPRKNLLAHGAIGLGLVEHDAD